jgi:hypothetical protein
VRIGAAGPREVGGTEPAKSEERDFRTAPSDGHPRAFLILVRVHSSPRQLGVRAGIPYPTAGDSVRLFLMRCRIGFAWALAGGVCLAFLLALACHTGFTVGAPVGMSAPWPPPASIEPALAVQILQVQFDWHGLALRALSFSPALVAVCARHNVRQDAGIAPPHYGPLYRRPPPSFS